VSDEFQSVIPTGNWMYPVTKVTLPKGFEQLTIPEKAFSFTAEQVDNNRKAWIREWQRALID